MSEQNVTCLELSLPLDFLKTYIASLTETNPRKSQIGQYWRVHSNSQGMSMCLKTITECSEKDDLLVLFVFSEITIGLVNNKISLRIQNVDKMDSGKMESQSICNQVLNLNTETTNTATDTNTVDASVSLSAVSLLKRKRGRPRKDEQRSTTKVDTCTQSQDLSNNYNLRKVRYKLPPSIVELEKGILKKELVPSSFNDFDAEASVCKSIKTELDEDGDFNESLPYSESFENEHCDGTSKKENVVVEREAMDTRADITCNKNVEQNAHLQKHLKEINQVCSKGGTLFNKQTTTTANKGKALVKPRIQDHPALKNIPSIPRKKRTSSKEVKCKYCKRQFCDYTGVDCHVRKFHQHETDVEDYLDELKPLKQMVCSHCQEVLVDRLAYNVHMSRVHGQSDAAISTCAVCEKSFKNIYRLKIHVRQIHARKKTYHLCHLCPSKFLYVATLKQHIEEIHEEIKTVSCDICKKTFYRTSQLNRHMRIHQDDEVKFGCDECDKKFRFRHNLRRHVKVMHNCKPKQESFHCSYCGHGFSQRSSMVAHVRLTHFSMHTFVCEICKATFQRSRHLSEHMLSGHGDNNFKVNRSRRLNYKYHRAPEDLYYCQFCSESFYYKAQLVEHMHTAHAKAFPHVCKDCNQGFLEKEFLTNHIVKAHNMDSCQIQDEISEVEPSEDVNRLKQLLRPHSSEIMSTCESNEPTSKSTFDAEQYNVITVDEEGKGKTSVIVEVANSYNTVHYVIEGAGEMENEHAAQSVVQDITNLLLAAEQSLQNLTSSQQEQSLQNLTSSEQQQSLQNLTSSEHQQSLQNLTSSEQEQSLQNLTSSEQQQSLQNLTSSEQQQSLQNLTSSQQEQSLQNLTSSEHQQSLQNLTSSEQEQSLQNLTSSEQQQSLQNLKSSQQEQSLQNLTSSEQQQSLQNITSSEQQQSLQNLTSSEQQQSLQNLTSSEQQQSLQNLTPSEQQQSLQNLASSEQQQSLQNLTLSEQEQSLHTVVVEDQSQAVESEEIVIASPADEVDITTDY